MNKSYSKIRHIEKSNLILESRLLNEQYSWAGSNTGTGTPVYNHLSGKVEDPNISQVRGYKSLEGEDDWWGQSEFDYNKSIDDLTSTVAHTLLTVSSIATSFIPVVGPFISAGIALGDAALYYSEGDTYTAGLTAMFSLIPGSSLLTKLIPSIKKLSAPALKNLITKMSSFMKTGKKPVLDGIETEVMDQIAKNGDEISKATVQTAKEAVETTTNQTVKSSLKNIALTGLKIAKPVAAYGSAAVGYNATYNAVQQNTPASVVSKEGHDWNKTKSAFGSSGSEQDNIQLYSAWKEGWRPGTVVPEKYQTAAYKKIFQEETENLDKLNALIAAAKESE